MGDNTTDDIDTNYFAYANCIFKKILKFVNC